MPLHEAGWPSSNPPRRPPRAMAPLPCGALAARAFLLLPGDVMSAAPRGSAAAGELPVVSLARILKRLAGALKFLKLIYADSKARQLLRSLSKAKSVEHAAKDLLPSIVAHRSLVGS